MTDPRDPAAPASPAATAGPERYAELHRRTRERLAAGTAPNPIRVTVTSESAGGFESRVRIRDFEVVIDQPKGFEGTNKGPKPSEVLLAALASCQEITWRLYAAAMNIPLTAVRVELTGTQDLRGFLDVDDAVPAGFTGITGTVHVESPASPEEIARLRDVVDAHCPVLDDLKRPVRVDLDVTHVAPGP
jgi:uncharacterized OsmC-like protein